jgi:hypothetical protein
MGYDTIMVVRRQRFNISITQQRKKFKPTISSLNIHHTIQQSFCLNITQRFIELLDLVSLNVQRLWRSENKAIGVLRLEKNRSDIKTIFVTFF